MVHGGSRYKVEQTFVLLLRLERLETDNTVERERVDHSVLALFCCSISQSA